MFHKVSQSVIDAALVRLADPLTGFNPTWDAATAYYPGVDAGYFNTDFTDKSKNFVQAQVSPDFLEQSSIFSYPLLCLYVLESTNANTQKFNQFSGAVRLVLEGFLSWQNILGKQNYEKFGNCLESTVVDIFNRVENQNWPNPVVYNGHVTCKRGPVTMAGQNWRQRVGFSLLFEAHTG